MKVAIITDTYTPYVSGVVNTVERIEEEFNLMGIDYKIFSPGDKDKNDKNHHFFKPGKFIFYNNMDFSFITSKTFKVAVDSYNPSLCHIVTEGPLGLLAARYCKKNDIPYVASYTTDLFNYFKYYAFDLLKPVLAMYLKSIHKDAYVNLAPSKISRKQLEDMDLYNNAIWQRGIDTDLFKPIKRKIGKKKKLLYVGRVAKEKNIGVILDMAEILNWQKYDFSLSIVGDGPIIEELKSREIKNVEFCGILKGEELAHKYASSDAFVFPSEHETFGNVILEAMASGVLVISSIKGGIIENLRDGENGIAIYENTASQFAKEVKSIFENQDKYWEIIKNARDYTMEKSWKKIALELLDFYKEALIKNK